MAIVINGSGTVTGLAVGGLPDGTVDDGTLASSAVTEAKIASSAVVTAKLNDDAVTNVRCMLSRRPESAAIQTASEHKVFDRIEHAFSLARACSLSVGTK